MRLFQAADTLALTGLTRSQLREWSGRGRRHLVSPDVEPEGPGRHALYAWQTILVLRLLNTLHSEFAMEVGSWAPAMTDLRHKLDRISFPSLWRSIVHFPNRGHADLLIAMSEVPPEGGIVLPLNPHLAILATKLSLPPPDQLPLFPAMAVQP